MSRIKVCCVQPRLENSMQGCFSRIEPLFAQAKEQGAEIVLLPEKWLPFSLLKDTQKYICEAGGEPVAFLQRCAEKYHFLIIGGAIWEYHQNAPKIASYVVNNQGVIVGRQEKLHLYLLEKAFFVPGNTLVLFHQEDLSFSVLICFDITFYETPAFAVHAGADILFTPTLIRNDGLENWNVYLRARALENRIPVVACNSVGVVDGSEYPGCSQILQFQPGHSSPSKLMIQALLKDAEANLPGSVNYSYPRRLRRERLAERLDANNLKLCRVKIGI